MELLTEISILVNHKDTKIDEFKIGRYTVYELTNNTLKQSRKVSKEMYDNLKKY